MNSYKENLGHIIDNNPLWDLFENNYNKYFIDKGNVIPKKIHQVWLGGSLPDKYKTLIATWKKIHSDWEYRLWTDADIDSFDMTNRKLFDATSNYGAKSDIFRYEIIYRHGGLYIDTDFECIKSFNEFLDLDFFAGNGHSEKLFIYNGLFAARPNHPILKNMIDALSGELLKSRTDFDEIMSTTGPDFFTKFVIDYMSEHNDRIVIFPQNYFYPFPAVERTDKEVRNNINLSKAHSYIKPTTYCIHLWYTAWQDTTEIKPNTSQARSKGWQLRVPKILHCYWGGEKMPYIRYMTIKSFMDQNPGWKIMLWQPKFLFKKLTWETAELKYDESYTDYMPELMKLPIEKNEIDFTDFGFRNNVSETYKSDLLRLHLLNICGGVWADSDILFFNPMTELSVNIPANKRAETFVCISRYGHSIGFMMAVQGSRFFERLSANAIKEYDENNYQSMGVNMYNRDYPTIESINKFSPAVNIPMDAVYAHDAGHVTELINGSITRFTNESIGCHWYAGHLAWGKFFKDTNGGIENLTDCIIGNLLKKAK
jgi:mannosyltransferase OCH1-like enzyme